MGGGTGTGQVRDRRKEMGQDGIGWYRTGDGTREVTGPGRDVELKNISPEMFKCIF